MSLGFRARVSLILLYASERDDADTIRSNPLTGALLAERFWQRGKEAERLRGFRANMG